MEAVREIVLPETKPAMEWILGRAVQKVSPKRTHALLQGALVAAMREWARGRGQVGTEWRFRVTPVGEFTRPLVPDVAYMSFERLRVARLSDLETPLVPPEIVIEIRSPGDREAHVLHKLDVYLAAGVDLVMILNPKHRTLDAHAAATECVTVTEGDIFEAAAFPGLRINVREIFAELDIPD